MRKLCTARLELRPPPQLRRDRSGTGLRLSFGELEAIPSGLAKPRDSGTARRLASSVWLLRRSGDGRFLACLGADGSCIELERGAARRCIRAPSLFRLLNGLGIKQRRVADAGLLLHAEPQQLTHAGSDRYGRPLWLKSGASQAWRRLCEAAAKEGVALEAISGFRSVEYQAAILRRKLRRGLSLDAILQVNAAPGYSEHHSGRAIDIGTPGEPAAEESFENTPAFAWLLKNAHRFGFRLSYPKGNDSGIQYEPWHWCWHRAPASVLA